MGIPPTSGGYPKMVTLAQGPNGGLVPAVYPAGHAKQFNYVIFNNAADEQGYTGNGIAPFSNVPSGGSQSWENRHH
jgi:hypothetical protein